MMDRYIADAADRAEQRASRSRARLNEGMEDVAELSREMADAGLISQENADETARVAKSVSEKLGQLPESGKRFANDQLKSIIERVERLEEEKKSIADDIRDVYAEAKGNGFDVKSLRVVVRLRKQDINERKEQEAILETYLHALGMI